MYETSKSLLYAYESIVILILCVGLLLNGAVVAMFIFHKEIRITSNIMIFNIAFCSVQYIILTLVLFLIYFVFEKSEFEYYIPHALIDSVYTLVSASSLMHYSLQRYVDVCKTLKPSVKSQFTACVKTTLRMISVWVFPLGFCLLVYFILHYLFESVFEPVYFGIIAFINIIFLPLFVAVYNLLARRKLVLSARMVQDRESKAAIIRSRYRNSRMLVDLAIAHICSYPWMTIISIAHHLRSNANVVIVGHIVRISICLYYARSILIPISLYKDNAVFEHLFNKYLFRYWYNPDSAYNVERRLNR